MTDRSLAGLVLAGGFSTRFGEEEKAVAPLSGTPMIRRVVDRLCKVTDEIVVNCRSEQLDALRDALDDRVEVPRFAVDPVADRGPIGGIHTGLDAIDAEYAAVVACDMPFLDPALFDLLLGRAQQHDGAVVRLDDGWFQTTQAIYRTDPMRRACADAIDAADNRILTALDELDWVVVEQRDLEAEGISLDTFESIDTKEDLRAAERRL